jgi:tetratricopeptide (TPR) repeat protein
VDFDRGAAQIDFRFPGFRGYKWEANNKGMAKMFNIPSSNSPSGAGTARLSAQDPPPSLPLQIFLFCAFLVTVAAYVVSQRSQPTDLQGQAQLHNEKLHQMFRETTQYQNYTKLGFWAQSQSHYSEAVSNFHNATLMQDVMSQHKAEAHYNLANALLLESPTNASPAFREYQAALHLDPTLRDAYLHWGQALLDLGKPDEAEQIYRQAIQQNGQFSLPHFKLAVALAARNRPTDALNEFAEASKLGLDDADYWLQYGTALNAQGRGSDAEAILAKASAIRSDLPGLHFQMGLAQQNQAKFSNAVGQYELMLTQMPDHADSLNNLALIYATAPNPATRNPKMAVSYATRASTLAGDRNPRFLDTLARSYAADGDFTQAVLWEDKAAGQAKLSGDKLLLADLTARLARFQQHKAD